MMERRNICLVICLIFCFYHAQVDNRTITKEGIDKEIASGRKNSVDQNKAIPLFLKINKNAEAINYEKGILESSVILMAKYYDVGNFKKVIELSNKAEKLADESHNIEKLSNVYRLRATAYTELGFNDESLKNLKKALTISESIPSEDPKNYYQSLTYVSFAIYMAHVNAPLDSVIHYQKKSLETALKINENKDYLDKKYHLLSLIYMNLGMTSVAENNMAAAEKYLTQSLDICRNKKYDIGSRIHILVLNEFAWLNYEQKKYDKVIYYAEQAEALEKKVSIPYARRDIYEVYFKSYVELGEKKASQKYMNLYTKLNDSLVNIEKKTINTPVKQIMDEQAEVYTKKIIVTVSAIIIVFLLAGWLLWKRNQKKLHKRYDTIIENQKANKTSVPAELVSSNISPEKSVNMKDETANLILAKLEKFEKSKKFIKKDLSLGSLATELNTNTRYLSEIIKQQKGKNYNNYVNSLRINYIVNKLYEDPIYREYKTSYLAEICGFSSREAFTVIFKKETGVPPSYFINNLKKDYIENEIV